MDIAHARPITRQNLDRFCVNFREFESLPAHLQAQFGIQGEGTETFWTASASEKDQCAWIADSSHHWALQTRKQILEKLDKSTCVLSYPVRNWLPKVAVVPDMDM